MWEELGISGGTAIIVLIALYFVVKWAVKNGITEAYEKITGKEVKNDLDEILEREAEKRTRKDCNKFLFVGKNNISSKSQTHRRRADEQSDKSEFYGEIG